MTDSDVGKPSVDTYDIVLLPGDGVGGEVVAAAVDVLNATCAIEGLEVKYESIPCGAQYYMDNGVDWPDGSEQRCSAADAILLGAIGLPSEDGRVVRRSDGRMAGWSAIVGNRVNLDLYANIRPVRLLPGVKHFVSGRRQVVWESSDVDTIFVRENTEDLYAGMGGVLSPGRRDVAATDVRIITRPAAERIVRLAFDLAASPARQQSGRTPRVTCVAKDNILFGCRLFVDVFHEIGVEYPEIEREVNLVDAFTQWYLRRPEHYDVVVAPNMFGDIITELASFVQGGVGMSAAANLGTERGMFEPIHGSAPKHAGCDRVNPIATILAASQMLAWLGTQHSDSVALSAARRIELAVETVVARGDILTYDLAGNQDASPLSAVTNAIVESLPKVAP